MLLRCGRCFAPCLLGCGARLRAAPVRRAASASRRACSRPPPLLRGGPARRRPPASRRASSAASARARCPASRRSCSGCGFRSAPGASGGCCFGSARARLFLGFETFPFGRGLCFVPCLLGLRLGAGALLRLSSCSCSAAASASSRACSAAAASLRGGPARLAASAPRRACSASASARGASASASRRSWFGCGFCCGVAGRVRRSVLLRLWRGRVVCFEGLPVRLRLLLLELGVSGGGRCFWLRRGALGSASRRSPVRRRLSVSSRDCSSSFLCEGGARSPPLSL